MIAARQIAFGRGGKRKPYDAEIEYLESTGTQWIDIGYYTMPNSVFYCGTTPIKRQGNGMCFWGSCKGDGTLGIGDSVQLCEKYASQGVFHFIDTYNSSNSIAFDYGSYYDIECCVSKCSIKANGVESFGKTNFILKQKAEFPVFMYARNLSGSANRCSIARFHYWKVYEDLELVLDLIPVRVGSVGYMYDRVSGRLFGNEGTGDFVLGPDI